MYTYFVALNYQNLEGYSGIGNSEISVNYRITSIDHIRHISKALESDQGVKNVIITNFILLREE